MSKKHDAINESERETNYASDGPFFEIENGDLINLAAAYRASKRPVKDSKDFGVMIILNAGGKSEQVIINDPQRAELAWGILQGLRTDRAGD